jgi:hypothetical protein
VEISWRKISHSLNTPKWEMVTTSGQKFKQRDQSGDVGLGVKLCSSGSCNWTVNVAWFKLAHDGVYWGIGVKKVINRRVSQNAKQCWLYSLLGRTAASIRLNTTFRGLAPSPSSGLRMGAELIPETLYSNQLTRLCAREDYIELCRREGFKTYIKIIIL